MNHRYKIVAVCKSCRHELWLSEASVSFATGAPTRSTLEVESSPDLSRTINKRMAMIWLPDVCPKCSSLRAVDDEA